METIVLVEGGDGSGKTSVCDWLRDEYKFKVVKLPTPGSAFEDIIFGRGDRVSKPSLKQKALAAVLDFANQIELAMASGDRIVLDRGPLSTVAYQSPQTAIESLVETDAMRYLDLITHVIILDVDPEVGLGREEVKNEVSAAGMEFHKKVNQAYKNMREPITNSLRFRMAEDIIKCERGTLNQASHFVSMHPNEADWKPEYDICGLGWLGLKDFLFLDTNPGALSWNQVKMEISKSIGLA